MAISPIRITTGLYSKGVLAMQSCELRIYQSPVHRRSIDLATTLKDSPKPSTSLHLSGKRSVKYGSSLDRRVRRVYMVRIGESIGSQRTNGDQLGSVASPIRKGRSRMRAGVEDMAGFSAVDTDL